MALTDSLPMRIAVCLINLFYSFTGAENLFYGINRFFLAFVIYPHQHLAQETHTDKLYTDDNQEYPKQQQRSAPYVSSPEELINREIERYAKTGKAKHKTHGPKKLHWPRRKAQQELHCNQI